MAHISVTSEGTRETPCGQLYDDLVLSTNMIFIFQFEERWRSATEGDSLPDQQTLGMCKEYRDNSETHRTEGSQLPQLQGIQNYGQKSSTKPENGAA
ncbi:hypothetical protein TNCV_459981 [Trichonephila clavipes]|nr:hypothetical protein TNCV_459981 [Trichonephila clavipes]